jgi:ATP-binding cassette subfamily B protein
LFVWILVVLGLAWEYLRRRRTWTALRMGLTHDLVERLVGHRTMLAQQPQESWHSEEDDSINRYLVAARRMDSVDAWLRTLGSRGWLLVGVAGVLPAFVAGTSSSALAIALGGVLLAHQAFRKLGTGLAYLAGAVVAWESIRPFVEAADPEATSSSSHLVISRATQRKSSDVLEAHGIVYRYRPHSQPVLEDCELTIHEGDRLLVEGPSGSGKSTLAMVLAGLRIPESGLLLVDGLDRRTLGADAWRRRIAVAPQFHDNHILAATLAFNLLMGRRWPPTRDDMKEAEAVCVEVGLGDLLAKLPSGLLQMVGDSGWQLSHGERSRVFIARTLLQDHAVVIFDESFAALDAANLLQAMQCVFSRAKTLLVVAHP